MALEARTNSTMSKTLVLNITVLNLNPGIIWFCELIRSVYLMQSWGEP